VRRRTGLGTLEFALVLPFMCALLLGVIEWGRVLKHESTLVHIVRDAASTGSRVRRTNGPEEAATTRCLDALADSGFDPAAAIVSTTIDEAPAGPTLTLSVVVPFAPLGGLVPVPHSLRAETTVRMQAP
jgi:hypothetical protein